MSNRLLIPGCLIILGLFCSCQSQTAEKSDQTGAHRDTLPELHASDASIPGNFSNQQKLHFDSAGLPKFLKAYPDFEPYRGEMTNFYSGRGYAYAWFDDQGLIEPSQDLYNAINNMTDQGIPMKVPYQEKYRSLIEGADSLSGNGRPDPEKELMITAQYFNYAHKVWAGLPESATKKLEWYVPRKTLAYDKLLDSMLQARASGKTLQEPVYPQYALLRDYLQRFRQLEKEGKWVTIPATPNKSYRAGDSAAVLATIRKRLSYSRDIAEDNGSAKFDSSLAQGVRSFQQRYGLKEDGVIGPSMIRELSAPISTRIKQIIVNMERCRWLPHDPKGDYLVVNIPQFKLLVYASDTLAWNCNVVVGKELNKTVIFSGDMKYVVFSPYWNVPNSIYTKEIAPAMRKNPNYLASHNMEWNGNQLREKPGPKNSLGLVKFLFPNSYNIYLHDSPAKSLFNEEKRTFSHGCIRVGEPKRLAMHLLRNDPEWDEQKITAAMNAGKERTVTLKQTLPVYIVYLTAWVDGRGRLNFRDDIYKRDARLMDLIFEKSGDSAQ
jgi:murein L,D-transpeptidase YcbB/YkuD